MMVEIGDQYATSWTLAELDGAGMMVVDAEAVAGVVDARTCVEAMAGRRSAERELRSRILVSRVKG